MKPNFADLWSIKKGVEGQNNCIISTRLWNLNSNEKEIWDVMKA